MFRFNLAPRLGRHTAVYAPEVKEKPSTRIIECFESRVFGGRTTHSEPLAVTDVNLTNTLAYMCMYYMYM